MKRIITFISVFALLLTACEGDQGPPGFDGLDGQDGINIVGETFERTVNFQLDNETGLLVSLQALPFDILDSDAILVYRLEGTVEVDGQETDAWSPLPQNFFLDENDIIQYVFNHTFVDVELLIDGNFDLSTLGADFTQNQTFKFVIVPADAINGIDTSDLSVVLQTFDLTQF